MTREHTTQSGLFAAGINNDANSLRGCFVVNAEDGPLVHPGASSSAVELSIDATTIRVDGGEWQLASGTETLEANTGPYPRADLVLARKGATVSDPATFDHLTGNPISADTFEDLTFDDPDEPHTPYLDQNGLPLHPVENIPQVQPPPGVGLRNEGPVLAMVWVPPGVTDSTGLSQEFIADFTKEGVSFEDVLRTGDALAEVESHNQQIEAHTENATRFGQRTMNQMVAATPQFVNVELQGGEERSISFQIPADYYLAVFGMGVVSGDTDAGTAEIQFEIFDGANWENRGTPVATRLEPNPYPREPTVLATVSGPILVRYLLRNTDSVLRNVTGQYMHGLYRVGNDYGYADETPP